jgi:hypothetical protein
MAPSVDPHTGRKPRLKIPEERHGAGAPPGPVHATDAFGNSAQAVVSAPQWRWHILHEQVCGFSAGPFARKRMFPHRLSEIGIDGKRLDQVAAMAVKDPSHGGNPIAFTEKQYKTLAKKALTGAL